MSADNFWHVVRHPDGGFTYCMGFASADELPTLYDDREYPQFDTVAEALCAAHEDSWTEYGTSIDPDITDAERKGFDYKELLMSYVDHVEEIEGSAFLEVPSDSLSFEQLEFIRGLFA